MNSRYEARLGMFKSVNVFMTESEAVIIDSGASILTSYNAALSGIIISIETNLENAAVSSRPATTDKAEAKMYACYSASFIAAAIYAYAIDTHKTGLAREMIIYNKSYLLALADQTVAPVLKSIARQATELIAVTPPQPNPLAQYAVGSAEIGTLEELIAGYYDQSVSPREAITSKKTIIQTIRKLHTDGAQLLKKMDKVIYSIGAGYPEFYEGYRNARKIVGPLTMHTRICGTLTDAVTGLPLDNVKITALADDGTLYRSSSNEEGNYAVYTPRFRHHYILKYSRPGYAEVQIAGVFVKRGRTTTRDLQIEPVIAT